MAYNLCLNVIKSISKKMILREGPNMVVSIILKEIDFSLEFCYFHLKLINYHENKRIVSCVFNTYVTFIG